jgi:uncharacterized protein YaiE (UPF0345 family)
MTAAFITLPEAKTDKTWDGLTVSMSSTGTTFAESLASVKMTFKLAGVESLTLTSAASQITITDAAAWEFTVEPIERLTLAAGVHSWAIETTSSAAPASVKDYLVGTIPVKADSTP